MRLTGVLQKKLEFQRWLGGWHDVRNNGVLVGDPEGGGGRLSIFAPPHAVLLVEYGLLQFLPLTEFTNAEVRLVP
jgi:hypothetical protein